MKCIKYIYLIIVSFLISIKAGASPFYLTVESSFSPNENAKVRLDYQDDKNEMELRILKPIELDKFLEGQLNISRTYEEPKSKLNPGYFIAKGINNVDLPLEKLRKFISPQFRQNFTDSLSNSIKILPKMQTVDKRKSIFILPPSSTKIVEKFRIPLIADAKQIDGETPGFEADFYGDISYKQKNISLPKLPSGIYLIQVVQGNNEAQSILQISDIAIQVKQSTNQIMVTAIDRALKPVIDATVHIRDSRGKWEKLPKKTNQYGQLLWEQATPFDSKLIVRVEKNALNAFASTEFLSVNQAKSDIFLMTDRPIFKPGEEVYFKGIMRSREQNQLVFPLSFFNKQIKRIDAIEIVNNKGENVQKLNGLDLTKYGSFSGKFNLDAEQTPGIYQLHAKTDHTPYSGEFRVRDYVKPTFYLSLEKIKGTFHPGKKIALKMKAIRYAGGAANDARFEVYVYRKKFEVPQWLSEEGFDLQSGSDYFGKKLSNSHNLPARVYSSVEERHTISGTSSETEEDNHSKYKLKENTEGVFSGSWTSANLFDVNGQAEYTFHLPKNDDSEEEWVYSLMVKAMDSQGSQAILTENYPVTLSEAFSTIAFKNKITDTAQKSNELYIYSSLPNGDFAPYAKGEVELKQILPEGKTKNLSSLEFKTEKNGIAVINIPKIETVGKIIATAKLTALNDKKMQTPSVSDSVEQIIADNKNSLIFNNTAVELYANTQHVEVNDKVKFLALLPESWAVIEKGIGWLTIAGDKIFEQKSIQLNGRSQWIEVEAKEFYGSGFYVTLTVPSHEGKFLERSISFKIIKKSKILNVNIQPEKLIAEPMKNLKVNFKVTKRDGSAAANTELVVAIVDKAVYDVQNEFRPKIFDFFYPDPKLNLMTFYSDDLQGYGFADHIRKENFDLFALKAKNQLAKNNMRDTAGWFPHVVTDATGNAQIVINMPANVTHWVINAVAIDPEGKFGEAKSTFRTATDITTTPNISQFMREGDELNFSVRYANTTNTATNIKTKIETGDGLFGFNRQEKATEQLPGLKDYISAFKIKATNAIGSGKLNFSLNAGLLTTGGNHEYSLKLLPNGISQIIPGTINNNSLAFHFSPHTKVTDINIFAAYGMTGYALHAAQWLATYPYGCTEQLVSSTLPNLVLLKLFNELGIKKTQLGDYAEISEKAQTNAQIGMKKLLENQLTNGAFSMWKQEPIPNVYMSIIAASGMQEALNLGLSNDIHEQLDHVKQWLREQKLNEVLYEKSTTKNENLLFLKKAALLNVLSNEFLEKMFKEILNTKDENSSLEAIVYALEILENWRNQHDSIWKIKTEHKQTLLTKLQNLLIRENELLKTRFKISQINNSDVENSLPFSINDLILYSSAYNILAKNEMVNHDFEKTFKDRLIEILSENNSNFGSTFITAQVIMNLKDVIKLEIKKIKSFSKNEIGLLNKNKEKITYLKAIPGGFSINYKVQQVNSTDLQHLELVNLPEGFSVFAYMKVFVPTNEVQETDNGMTIKKEFFRFNEKNSKLEKVNLADLKIGNIIFSKLTISRTPLKNPRYRHSNYFILEDNIPSLAESLDSDQYYLSDAGVKQEKSLETKRYSDKIVHVFELPNHNNENKSLEVYNVWRVNFTGVSSVPAAKVTDMYNENIFGVSASFEVKNK